MKPIEQMSDEQLERHALEILSRELGPHGLARFLRVFRSGTGDYTAERKSWLEEATVNDVVKDAGSRQVS
jgi:hypothetical protein